MRLNDSQLREYRYKLCKEAGIPSGLVLYSNGIFEFTNIHEFEYMRALRILKETPFVEYVNGSKSRYDFSTFDFSKGFAQPKNLYNIIGKIKLEEDVIKEEVQIHNQLNPIIWTEDNELKTELKEKIEEIVEKFIENLKENEIKIKVEDIYILGSNANYNYNEESDLDIHIIADESFDCKDEHLPKLYQAYKTLFNTKYDINFKGINVEIYVENKDKLSNVSSGIYSLNKGWLKNPIKNNIPKINQDKIELEVIKWKNKIEKLIENPMIEDIEKIIDALYEIRIESINSEGEFGEGNLIFKEIRRKGLLDKLKEIKIELESKELSLENLNEDLEPVLYHGTYPKSALLILRDNMLKLGKVYGSLQPAVCLTRDKNFIKTSRFPIVFELDRNKLHADYKIQPISDYKNVYGGSPNIRYKVNSKAEEVVYKDIKNLRRYIKKIYIESSIKNKVIEVAEKNNIDLNNLVIEEI